MPVLLKSHSQIADFLVEFKFILLFRQRYKRICAYELRLKVGKRKKPKILGIGIEAGAKLIAEKRDKETKLRYLCCNRLDINSVDAVFDKIKFPLVIWIELLYSARDCRLHG